MSQEQYQTEIGDVIRRCLRGDRRAQWDLFNRYREPLFRLVYRVLGPMDRNRYEEVLQQMYVQIFKSLTRFRRLSSFDTWVDRIGTRVCMMYLRKKYHKKRVLSAGFSAADVDQVGDHRFRPDHELDRRLLQKRVYAALDRLRPERRVVLVLHDIEGRSIEEIALLLGKAQGTVKSRMFRARKELKKALFGEEETSRQVIPPLKDVEYEATKP